MKLHKLNYTDVIVYQRERENSYGIVYTCGLSGLYIYGYSHEKHCKRSKK